ncbi:MAG: LptA/OstA family protein [Bryobacteraceae bacterium]
MLLAIVLMLAAVTAAFVTRRRELARHRPKVSAPLPGNTLGTAEMWEYEVTSGDEAHVRMRASSFRQIQDPSRILLKDLEMQVRNLKTDTFDLVKTAETSFDTANNLMYAEGDVEIRVRLPLDGSEPDKKMIIHSTGVHFDTKSQKVWTERHARMEFDGGEGEGDGASYDPATHVIEVNSAVKIHWQGEGGGAPMELEAAHAVYHEQGSTIELQAPVKLQRGTLSVEGGPTLVTLVEGQISTVETAPASGFEQLPKRKVDFSAQRLKLWFNGESLVQRMEGNGAARVLSHDAGGETMMSGDKLEMSFVTAEGESQLSHAVASGHGRMESHPAPRPAGKGGGEGKPPAQQGPKIMTSDVLELMMKPGGQEIDQARTVAPGRLEFLPASPGDRHRQLDASQMTVWYGAQNVVSRFHATKAATRTETPARPVPGGKPKPATVTLTKSRELEAHFDAKGQMTTMDQMGDFSYAEETRRATADAAQMDQVNNVMLLRGHARAWDETGSTDADDLRIDQKSGATLAKGHVSSLRLPDQKDSKDPKNAGDGGLIANDKPMLGSGQEMSTWDHNRKIRYTNDAVVWQGSTRIQARDIFIDREAQRLEARDGVVTRVPDESQVGIAPAGQNESATPAPAKEAPKPQDSSSPHNFSVITAAVFDYDGKIKQGLYQDKVHLVRPDLDLRSRFLRAFFEDAPKQGGGTETKLEHLQADGAVQIVQRLPGHLRNGNGDHAEYYLEEQRMVLTGNQAEVSDPDRGSTKGPRITWLSRYDKLVVEGEKKSDRISSRSTKAKQQQ